MLRICNSTGQVDNFQNLDFNMPVFYSPINEQGLLYTNYTNYYHRLHIEVNKKGKACQGDLHTLRKEHTDNPGGLGTFPWAIRPNRPLFKPFVFHDRGICSSAKMAGARERYPLINKAPYGKLFWISAQGNGSNRLGFSLALSQYILLHL
jgi:hypothetical protein